MKTKAKLTKALERFDSLVYDITHTPGNVDHLLGELESLESEIDTLSDALES